MLLGVVGAAAPRDVLGITRSQVLFKAQGVLQLFLGVRMVSVPACHTNQKQGGKEIFILYLARVLLILSPFRSFMSLLKYVSQYRLDSDLKTFLKIKYFH